MVQRVEMQGCNPGHNEWDDGSDHDDVKTIYVRGGLTGVHYIHVDYVKSGQTVYGSIHGYSCTGFTQKFEIDHLKKEQLESVDIYYSYGSNVVQAVQFKTNLRVSEIMGYRDAPKMFTLAVEGKKIIGFHGSAAYGFFGLGAYFDWIPATKMEAKGGTGGQDWDDGSDHEAITKIQVQYCSTQGIEFIKFNYIKDGQPKDGPIHGLSVKGSIETFEINHHNKEYLVSVEGYYNEDSNVIQGLQFKTNKTTSELIGDDDGERFKLAINGKKIIGFHGYAEKNLNSLGAYFITIPPTKFDNEEARDLRLNHWDDGAFEGVRKVYVHYESSLINYIGFDYQNGYKMEKSQHGLESEVAGQQGEFVVDFPNEYITSVEGTFQTWPMRAVSSLTFNTSKGRTSPTFGGVSDDRYKELFVLKSSGCALVGFYGKSGLSTLYNLGAYFRRLPPHSHSEKLEAQGGEGGASWDDGDNFNDVRKIIVGLTEIGIAFVKFVYDKDTQMVFGDDHGNRTMLDSKEFKLDYPSEYLTSVEGSYDQVGGSESEVIQMLKFTTNKQTSPTFGLDKTASFLLHKDRNKIVGFHGKSGNMLHKIGVHVMPISHHHH